jgi:hypothetical protein
MQVWTNLLDFLTGTPALIGLLLTALVLFLAADWRVAMGALLVQYVLIALTLTDYLRPEVVLVRLLVGLLATLILYLGARRIRDVGGDGQAEGAGPHLRGWHLGWLAGPLGFPLRLLAALLAVLATVRVFGQYNLAIVPMHLGLMAFWMVCLGLLGLVLSGNPLRVGVAVLTILSGFELVYLTLEPSLALVGFLSAFDLVATLGLSYLATVHYLAGQGVADEETRS